MITKLRVQNFRKHEDFTVDFTPGTSIVIGLNGSGKTSLIEAIHIALQGKSWRSNFSDILRTGADWWRVDIEFDDGEKRVVRFENGEKNFEIDSIKSKILTAKNKKPVVLFEPNDLNLLYGSPSRRRDFFDNFIEQIDVNYHKYINDFNRILSQRNNLLRQGSTLEEMFVWDIQFANVAAQIIKRRKFWAKEITKLLSLIYRSISDNNDVVEVIYLYYQDSENIEQNILNELRNNFQKETTIGYTTYGPHRHDFLIKLNNNKASDTASRGENRTIILAIKNSLKEFLTVKNKNPILLYDDVFGELDELHELGLMNLEKSSSQVIVTGLSNLLIPGSDADINYHYI